MAGEGFPTTPARGAMIPLRWDSDLRGRNSETGFAACFGGGAFVFPLDLATIFFAAVRFVGFRAGGLFRDFRGAMAIKSSVEKRPER